MYALESLEARRFLSTTPVESPLEVTANYELNYDVARPKTPANFRATGKSPSTVVCTWTDVSGETSYELQGRKGGTSSWTTVKLPKNTTSYTVTGLESSTRYEFRVRARNSSGASSWSNIDGGTTLAGSVPNEEPPPPPPPPPDPDPDPSPVDGIKVPSGGTIPRNIYDTPIL
jgi:hypothetical protein